MHLPTTSVSAEGAAFIRAMNRLKRRRARAIRRTIRLFRRRLGGELFAGRLPDALLIGWVGFMCDCAQILLHARTVRGNRDLALAWLRPIVEASILLHWVGTDTERAWRVMRSQHRHVEKRRKDVEGTIFDFDVPLEPAPPGKGLPPVTEMAREVGSDVTAVFLLESERLHPDAATAVEYVRIVEGLDAQLDEQETMVLQLRPARVGLGRESGVLAQCLHHLLRAGIVLDERFQLGLREELAEIASRGMVDLEADAAVRPEWERLFDRPPTTEDPGPQV